MSFNDDQPRDEHGRWMSTEGGAEAHFAASDAAFPKVYLTERDVRNTTRPRDEVYGGSLVSGLSVRTDIPNTGSISATFDEGDYEELPGIREVPIDAIENTHPDKRFYDARDRDHVHALAEQIRESGEISPLIVVVDHEARQPGGKPYVLEGQHRVSALHVLGKPTFPALVIVDYTEPKSGKAMSRFLATLKEFDPDQPRDENGQWSDQGGASPASEKWASTLDHQHRQAMDQWQYEWTTMRSAPPADFVAAVNSAPDGPGKVYRGLALDAAPAAGSEVSIDSHSSGSRTHATAAGFAEAYISVNRAGRGKEVFVLEFDGARNKDISGAAWGLDEVILLPGQKGKVVSVGSKETVKNSETGAEITFRRVKIKVGK